MARFEKSRPKSAKPHAAVAPARSRASTAASIEDTMFFPRLRRHAKWMFVFLALVFALGFVVFGVGAGGTGVGDIFRGSGGSSGQSVSDARKETEQHPKSAQAWRDYATALETEGQTAEAITALNTAIDLNPKDESALRELAGLHLTRATERQQDAQLLQVRALFLAPSQGFPALTGPAGQTIFPDRVSTAVNAEASGAVNQALQDAQTEAALAVDAYKRLVALQPNNPNVQLELAQAAQQVGDATTAITAYEKFLKLAPDDPSAAVVREQLKQLRGTAAAASG
jgi:tetratricopeptide (TPR) repeat protein